MGPDADWLFDKLTEYRDDWDTLAAINKAGDTGGEGRVHGGPGGRGGQSSDQLSRKYFSQISKESIKRLYQKYQVDFEMFDYENQIQMYIDMGT